MNKSEAKIGMKVHPIGRGDKVLYINEIGEDTAGVSSVKGSKSNSGVFYHKLIKFKVQAIDPKDFIDKATVSYQYVDYEENEWTMPVKMTKERLDNIYNDPSITKLRIKPIDSDIEFEIDVF